MSRSRLCVWSIAWGACALGTQAQAQELQPWEIYKMYGKGVVLVFATDGSSQGSAGTGSIITEDGQIITNAHVIAKDGRPYKKLFVYTKPDKLTGSMQDDLKLRYEAQIVSMDQNLDLALLKMKAPPTPLVVIPFADPDAVETGDPVLAIGHPETGGLWTMTTGIISSSVKDFDGKPGKDVFQTEASINRGNSGGPLLNRQGQMVGINTSISRKAADGLAITSINFSLKSSVPVNWMKKKDLLVLAYARPMERLPSTALASTQKPSSGSPGAQGAPASEEPKTYAVKGDEGKEVVVVEPDTGEEVAQVSWQSATQSSQVSGSIKMKPQDKKSAQQPPSPKLLTQRRPYKLEPFIEARVREIKALEKDMDAAQRRIDEVKRNKKSTKKRPAADGMGLW